MQNKKLWTLVALLLVAIPITSAVTYWIVSYDMSLESLGETIVLRDEGGIVIGSIVGPSLYQGQSESVYFQLLNVRSSELSISLEIMFPLGFEMADSEFGTQLEGETTWVGVVPGDPFSVPAGLYVTVGVNVMNQGAVPGSCTAIVNVTILN